MRDATAPPHLHDHVGRARSRLRRPAAVALACIAVAATGWHAVCAHAADGAEERAAADARVLIWWAPTLISVCNLAINFSIWAFARRKAGQDALVALEAQLRAELALLRGDVVKDHDHVHSLEARVDLAPTHDHLAEVYRELKGMAQHLHQLVGQQQQITENLRLIMSHLVKDKD